MPSLKETLAPYAEGGVYRIPVDVFRTLSLQCSPTDPAAVSAEAASLDAKAVSLVDVVLDAQGDTLVASAYAVRAQALLQTQKVQQFHALIRGL